MCNTITIMPCMHTHPCTYTHTHIATCTTLAHVIHVHIPWLAKNHPCLETGQWTCTISVDDHYHYELLPDQPDTKSEHHKVRHQNTTHG